MATHNVVVQVESERVDQHGTTWQSSVGLPTFQVEAHSTSEAMSKAVDILTHGRPDTTDESANKWAWLGLGNSCQTAMITTPDGKRFQITVAEV